MVSWIDSGLIEPGSGLPLKAAFIARWSARLVTAIGLFVLIGLISGAAGIFSLMPGLPAPSMAVAVTITLMGIALSLVDFNDRLWARITGMILAALIFATGIGTVIVQFARLDVDLCQILVNCPFLQFEDGHPQPIPPVQAFGAILFGASVFLLHRRGPVAASVAAWMGCVLGILGLSGLVLVGLAISGSSFFAWMNLPNPISLPGVVATVLTVVSVIGRSIARLRGYPTHRRFLRPRIWLLAIMTAFAVASFLVWIALAFEETVSIGKSLDSEAMSSTRLLEEYTERSLDASYLMTDRVADMVDAEGFDRVVSSVSDWKKISGMVHLTPQINSIVLINAEGRVKLISTEFPILSQNTDASGREYYLAHRDQKRATFVGPTITTAISHLGAFTVSQRLEDSNGKFQGLVLATIKVAPFETFFDSLHLSHGMAIGLFLERGDLLAGYSQGLTDFGADVLAKAAPGVSGHQVWLPGDGTRRFISYRRMSDRPILIAAEVLHDDSIEVWRSVQSQTAPGLLAVLILLTFVTWFWVGNIHREEAHHQQLEEMATTDPLTQTANRRAFVDNASREISRARRFGSPLSLLLIDADHFKRVNDKYGHAAGDHVLIVLAAICRTHLRNIDLIGRIGGEEFAVALARTDLSGALIVAEKIRTACANTAIAVPGGTISLTVSIGVAKFDPGMADLNELMQAADTQLYRAKESGRNQVLA